MDIVPAANGVKKMEDTSDGLKAAKQVVRTLNRVPRACNACRRQKMRCEGADNPPCRRCRTGGLECLFEKPSREATLTGEAGLERIRNLENHVAEIRITQDNMQSTLQDIASMLRNRGPRSPSTFPPPLHHPSPGIRSIASPSMSSTPPGVQHPGEGGQNSSSGVIRHRDSVSSTYRPIAPNQAAGGQFSQPGSYGNYPASTSGYNSSSSNVQTMSLPPISSIGTFVPHPNSVPPPSTRYPPSPNDNLPNQSPSRHPELPSPSSSKRTAPTGTSSSYSTDGDGDEEDGGLPARGLVEPLGVLIDLAHVASERARNEYGDSIDRPRSAVSERRSRSAKRRKKSHIPGRTLNFPDAIARNIISENEAHELFQIFYRGCSTFLPVFDAKADTLESLRLRSPFAVDCICMVAARVRDGGGGPSETYSKLLEQVQGISSTTLFKPVCQHESVQAMLMVSGWSTNGWLSGGHSVRMAMELFMHQAWPKLSKRMKRLKPSDLTTKEDQELATAARIWFCLYLFEHQMSYGTGRPAVLKEDESISHCRFFLQHPLSVEDDMRLVSTVELMAIRERIQNKLAPYDGPVDDHTLRVLQQGADDFQNWYDGWDAIFASKYDSADFYRQSLKIQQVHAELFHNATALRGINGPHDVQQMPDAQRTIALKSIHIAKLGLHLTVNSPSYREGMKYAVHYTHATATFAASFLLRLALLFPDDCDQAEIRMHVEQLVELLAEIPGKRYAWTLRLMLRGNERRSSSASRSPKGVNQQAAQPPLAMTPDLAVNHHQPPPQQHPQQPLLSQQQQQPQQPTQPYQQLPQSPMNDHVTTRQPPYHPGQFPILPHQPPLHPDPNIPKTMPLGHQSQNTMMIPPQYYVNTTEPPFWMSNCLGGNAFPQFGMDAFLLPPDLPPEFPPEFLHAPSHF